VLTIGRARAQEKDDTSTDAIALHRAFKNAPTKTDRELAQFDLAVFLYRLRFYRAAFGIFSDIADHPEHMRFSASVIS
jgi:hypothetical protein